MTNNFMLYDVVFIITISLLWCIPNLLAGAFKNKKAYFISSLLIFLFYYKDMNTYFSNLLQRINATSGLAMNSVLLVIFVFFTPLILLYFLRRNKYD